MENTMRQAKLIKQRDQQNQQEREQTTQQTKEESRQSRSTVETAKEWVREFQSAERRTPRRRFAALFS
jgi:hypothetical protein